MEEKLLEIIKLVDELNEKQDKVYAQITYSGDDYKKLSISIRTKREYKYVETIEIQLKNSSLINWNNIIHLFESYVNGGVKKWIKKKLLLTDK